MRIIIELFSIDAFISHKKLRKQSGTYSSLSVFIVYLLLSASNSVSLPLPPPPLKVRPTCHCVFSGGVLSFVSMVTGIGSSGVVVALPVLEADHLSG